MSTKVLASGVFDILHPGHIYYLSKAKSLGDHLIVIVACDSTARNNQKHPIFSEDDRLHLVRALKMVDEAHIGRPQNHLSIVKELEPDIIALGYDQEDSEQVLKDYLHSQGLDTKIVRISKYESHLDASSKIKQKVLLTH